MKVTTKIHVLSESVPKWTAHDDPKQTCRKVYHLNYHFSVLGFGRRLPWNGTHFKFVVINDRKTMEWIVKQWSGAFGETELYENYECQGRKAKTLETKKWWSCTDFQQIRHPNPPTVSQFKMQTKTWFFDKIFTSSSVQNDFTESGQILSNN